ncbi:YCII-related domain-containing protein [Agromyces sp. CF514]|uniref:YciI family protein n=1 Tax=Agromyces sp. CF514 TaxID=1881031 RepID=UPI0008E028A7|nr:YciI family protein [Agromyces sp. CF514]SFR69680.1 YCII-related domain-containing protein [Agromyces sp. CF514]
MKYFMFVATDTQPDRSGDEGIPIEQWVAENDERGTRIDGERLQPVRDATLVRVRDGELLVTDGPFTESKEWIAGYDILECRDLDEAIEIASRHPMARGGRIELRPFWNGADDE